MMKNTNMHHRLVFALTLVCLLGFAGLAQENKSPSVQAPEWWKVSSRRNGEPLDTFQKHLELQFSGERLTGNESGTELSGHASFVLRRRIWSWYSDLSLSHKDKDYGLMGETKETTYRVGNFLRQDFDECWFASTGIINERDDTMFVDSRNDLLLGVGYDWFPLPNLQITPYLAAGYEHVSYDISLLKHFSPPFTGEDDAAGAAAIAQIRTIWKVNDFFSVRPDARYLSFTDGDMDDRWQLGCSLQFDVHKHVSLILRGELNQEENAVIRHIGGKEHNTAIKWLLRITF